MALHKALQPASEALGVERTAGRIDPAAPTKLSGEVHCVGFLLVQIESSDAWLTQEEPTSKRDYPFSCRESAASPER